ncbi:hypothetical protein JW872_00925 [Candidatus Babeliales bacterium]|nr:hypothetical protein [Candidatus Babeliales bacterium]
MRKYFYSLLCLIAAVGMLSAKSQKTTKAQTQDVDVLLLLALPASGKSEVRHYLASLTPQECRSEFGIKETVQLDDFPYVHIMRRVSDEMTARGHEGPFFASPAYPFREPKDWGTLTVLLNDDYDDLVAQRTHKPRSASEWLFKRYDQARISVGAAPVFSSMDAKLRKEIAQAVEQDAQKLLASKNQEAKKGVKDKTVVIEFARGGAESSPMPLPQPYGYQYALSQLSPAILEKASLLYIWVDPAESRRKNLARANPNDPGSILNHCVPQAVMYTDYGCDDIAHLVQTSDKPNTICVSTRGQTFHIPVGRFDNRVDKTTFVHSDHATWKAEDIANLKSGLQTAFHELQDGRRRRA